MRHGQFHFDGLLVACDFKLVAEGLVSLGVNEHLHFSARDVGNRNGALRVGLDVPLGAIFLHENVLAADKIERNGSLGNRRAFLGVGDNESDFGVILGGSRESGHRRQQQQDHSREAAHGEIVARYDGAVKRPPKRGFSTLSIHAGQSSDPATGAIVAPIYQTSTFAQEGLGRNKGYEYARVSNPTRTALETNLAVLEGGALESTSAFAFASGMAAIDAVLSTLSAGDHVICQDNLYGGTVRLFNQILTRFGMEFTYVDASRVENLEAARRPNTRLLFLETPTNPLMRLIDLAACSKWAARHGLLTAVDNTFMTPYFQRPLELGADIVIHSTTKYINGHSDGIGGAVVARDPEVAAKIKFMQKAAGAILAPFECWLLLRGVKTLGVRMRQHDANAREVARWLASHKKIGVVHYPGLPDHPQHKLARRQMSGFGGMLSFDLGSRARAAKFFERLRIFSLAESLGGVESLVAHPATMSHAGISEDLISDLEQALRAV